MAEGEDAAPKNPAEARLRARHFVVQALYQQQMNDTPGAALAAQFLAEQDFSQADRGYFQDAVLAIVKDLDAIDAHYASALDRSAASLDPVTRALLRLGSWELAERIDIPVRVVLDQCVTLAHRFGASESHRYINAVLDGVARRLRATEMAAAGKR